MLLSNADRSIWSDAERIAWQVPPRHLPSHVWSEEHRLLLNPVIPEDRRGPWRNRNQPALVPIMLLIEHEGINEIGISKAAQVGVSEAVRNVLGRRAHVNPCGVGVLLPDEETGRKVVNKYWRPVFDGREVPALRDLQTGDPSHMTMHRFMLANGMDVQLQWAGSASSLAAEPRGFIFCDEVDKYPKWDGVEARPTDLARVRTNTYRDKAKIVLCSTPTTEDGEITRFADECGIKMYYHSTCPHCGTGQRLRWDAVKWEFPDGVKKLELFRQADHLESADENAVDTVWYQCESQACQASPSRGRISQRQFDVMVQRLWLGTIVGEGETGDWRIHADGRIEGQKPPGRRAWVSFPGYVDTCRRLSRMAADFWRRRNDPAKLHHFKNSELGEFFIRTVESVKADVFEAKCRANPETGFKPGPARVVPRWASRLLMAIDMQKDHFYYVIRAWGPHLLSRRIDHGMVSSFDQLNELIYLARWHYEPEEAPAGEPREPWPALRIEYAGIDTGGSTRSHIAEMAGDVTRTAQSYLWVRNDPIRRLALKGSSTHVDLGLRRSRVKYDLGQGREEIELFLHLLDPSYWHERLASMVRAKIPEVNPATGEVLGEVDQWQLNNADDPVYNRHMAEVTRRPTKKGGGVEWVWGPKTDGARHDYHDCERMMLAMAMGPSPANCMSLPSAEELARANLAIRKSRKPITGGYDSPDGRPFLVNQR